MNDWVWEYEGFDPDDEGQREALCTLANGYLATRGALPECDAGDVHYPGCYLAGVYNRLRTEVAGRTVENESLVNAPNWLYLRVRPVGGDWFDPQRCEVLDHHLELDTRRALLTRRSRFRDPQGRILAITQRRFVSLRDHHLAGLQTTLVAENFSDKVEIVSAIDGRVTNSGVGRYARLDSDHLIPVVSCAAGAEVVCLEVETNDSHVRIAQSARTRLWRRGALLRTARRVVSEERYVAQHVEVSMAEGVAVTVEKVVATFTSRDDGIYEAHAESEEWATNARDFDELLGRSIVSWSHAWNRGSIEVEGATGHTARVLNLHIFHLLQTVSRTAAELDVGVPARGLHGEAYRGHVFWDEVFIFPFLNWRVPELTRALLRYRSRRLDQARWAAKAAGYQGAMYPWQSGSNGREETQTLHLNPESGRWLADASHLQRHINGAIAYNVWSYWQVTGDLEFMRFWGAEMILEIARFWSSAASYDHALDRYEIRGVMGPDEYHEGYPDSDGPGLDNNSYTNLLAVWCLCRAFDVLEVLPGLRGRELLEKLELGTDELDRWGDISRKMRLCFHDEGQILSQFEGYGDLAELDWDAYRARYGDIGRLDRILEAEGDSPNRYKLAKQADTLMLFYLFSAEEVSELIGRLGYPYDDDFIPRHIAYYEPRTSHGSTLSEMVHAWLHTRLDRERGWELFWDALMADVADAQGGTTREGIHLGAMAGTVDLVQRCFTGIETRGDVLHLNPRLPVELGTLRFPLRYRGHLLDLTCTPDRMVVAVSENGAGTLGSITVNIRGEVRTLDLGDTFEATLD